jgi:hypothetical protein
MQYIEPLVLEFMNGNDSEYSYPNKRCSLHQCYYGYKINKVEMVIKAPNILVGESKGKEELERPRRRWEDNNKVDLKNRT